MSPNSDCFHRILRAVTNPARDSLRTSAQEHPSLWFNWTLSVVIFVGVALRVGYIDHSYFHPDEQIAQALMRSLSFPHQWDSNWIKSDVTRMFHYGQYNFSSYHYLLYFWKECVELCGIDWIGHPGALRALNGLFGGVFIGAIALASRSFAGEVAGVAAASAGAVLPLLVQDAHYLRSESMMTAGTAVLLWLSMRRAAPGRWIIFFGGWLAGWLIACKVTMGLVLPLLLPMLLPSAALNQVSKRLIGVLGASLGLGLVVGFVAGVPFGVLHPDVYFSGLAKLSEQYRSPMPPYTTPDMAPSILVTLAYLKGTLGWGFWSVTALGFCRTVLASGWCRGLSIASPLVAAFAVFGWHPFFIERSYSPYLPIAVFLFGVGGQFAADCVWRSAIWPGFRAGVVALGLAGALALPAIYSWRIVVQGFSGREVVESDAALAQMRGELSGELIKIIGVEYTTDDHRLISDFYVRKKAMLILLCDCYDANTPHCIAMLENRFGGRVVGVRESIFSGLPACSLHLLLSPRIWLIYIPAK